MQAVRTATNAQSSGDCGRIMIVLLTDGRANVSLAKSNEEPDAIAEGAPKPTQELLKTEVLDMAKRCGSSGFNLLVIDTENKARPAFPFMRLGRSLHSVRTSRSPYGTPNLQRCMTWVMSGQWACAQIYLYILPSVEMRPEWATRS